MGNHEELVGIAGVLGLISFSTLVQTVYSTRNTASLPWTWIIINITAQILSLIYGILNGAYGIYIPNTLFLSGLGYIFYIKINNIDKPEAKEEAKEAKEETKETEK
jgi:uncharacterized protein with PQ loop repeat